MKRYKIALLFASSLLFVQCSLLDKFKSKDEDDAPATNTEEEEGSYTSHWYYSYEVLEQIDFETMGLGSVDEFKPYTVASLGDTLFVANIAAAPNVIVFDKAKSRPLSVISDWEVNGQTKGFGSIIYAIVATNERLYVAERESRIHVFGLPDLNYITCIGNGKWGGPVFEAQALAVKDGMIYARDKDGGVSIYKDADATPENYEKVQRYKKTATYTQNNGFNPHYMEFDTDGNIMLTDFEGMAIRVLDPSLVTEDMKNGTSIDIEDKKLLTNTFKPRTFAVSGDRLYVTANNGAINIYDYEQKEWVKTLKSAKGMTFGNPERVYADNDILWVSDINKKVLAKMGVFKNEIREYSKVSPNIIKVDRVMTYGDEPETFYVDITTHEIVDPFAE